MKNKTGLWKTESKNGKNYYKGKIKIGEKEYNIAIFKNEKSKDTQPDLTLYFEEKTQEKEKTSFTPDELVHDDDLAF